MSFQCLAINEPDCLINGYYRTGKQILEYLRSFIIASAKGESQCSKDEQLSVGCLFVDFILPMLEETYFMEAQFLIFL